MQNYDNFPPCDLLLSILKMVPESAFTYLQAYSLRNKKNQFIIKKSECRQTLLTSPTVFRNQMLPLAARGLLSFDETIHEFHIDLNVCD